MVELRLVGNDAELFFVRLQNFMKPAKTAGKSLAGLLRAAFLGRRLFFIFHANSLQMSFQAPASMANGTADGLEGAYLSKMAGWR